MLNGLSMGHDLRASSSAVYSLARNLLRRTSIDWRQPPSHSETGFTLTQPMAKILLAEDDEDLRRFLVKALEKAGHNVTSFGEGASAFEEIKQTNFDLLLTDIVMPEMDGIELARRAAELDPALKIMFITGFAAVALNPDSRAPKDAKVLSKPFHLRDLVNEVNRMMAA
jgi:two-component system cell cycle response regulator CpdR